MADNSNMNGKDFVIGALLGGIIGAGAALLLAPKSGKELRVDISDGYQTAAKKTQEFAKNVGEQTGTIVEKVKEVATHVKEDVQRWRGQGEKDTSFEDETNEKVQELAKEAAAAYDEAQINLKQKLEETK